MKRLKTTLLAASALATFLFIPNSMLKATAATASPAVTPCVFNTSGTTITLQGDCVTDISITIPNGFTMDLGGFTVVAVDPVGDHFRGAVIRNIPGGTWAGLENGIVTTANLANVCDAGDDRLRGVMFEGAAGYIYNLAVDNINQGASGCQEGNAIEVRNAPFDGLGINPLVVEVSSNVLTNWQKTGIVANGNVDAWIHHNVVSPSSTQANLAANSVQVGFGGKALVEHNHIGGNSWLGASNFVGTSVLLFEALAGTVVKQNVMMDGNSDIGIYVFANGVTVDNNKIFEAGEDLNQNGWDIALGDYGAGNAITNNKAKGYATAYDGVVGGRNKDIPAPSKQ